MGPPGSPVWHSMLDGAEEVLREEGYGALTSRRIAECIGVKQRLIYYYFHTMDDLIVETFRRLAIRDLENLSDAMAKKLSLHEIWEFCIDSTDSRLTSEFIALANRIERLRAEVISYTEKSRQMITEALAEAAAQAGGDAKIAPVAAAFLTTSAAIALHREAALGTTMGHAEALDVIRKALTGTR